MGLCNSISILQFNTQQNPPFPPGSKTCNSIVLQICRGGFMQFNTNSTIQYPTKPTLPHQDLKRVIRSFYRSVLRRSVNGRNPPKPPFQATVYTQVWLTSFIDLNPPTPLESLLSKPPFPRGVGGISTILDRS